MAVPEFCMRTHFCRSQRITPDLLPGARLRFNLAVCFPMPQSGRNASFPEFGAYSRVASMLPDSYFFSPLWKNHIANPAKNAAANSCAATQTGA